MTENACSNLLAGSLGDFGSDDFGDAAEAVFSARGGMTMLSAGAWGGSLGHHAHRTLCPTLVTTHDLLCDFVIVKGNLRDEDHVRSPGKSAVESDPSGVPPHNFKDHDTIVRRRRGMQSIQRVGHAGNRRIKAKGHRGRFEIVIDRLRNADDWNTFLVELERGR